MVSGEARLERGRGETAWMVHSPPESDYLSGRSGFVPVWGHSSAGRAPPLQGGGRRFETGWLHFYFPTSIFRGTVVVPQCIVSVVS
jgi:hypothetical protein